MNMSPPELGKKRYEQGQENEVYPRGRTEDSGEIHPRARSSGPSNTDAKGREMVQEEEGQPHQLRLFLGDEVPEPV